MDYIDQIIREVETTGFWQGRLDPDEIETLEDDLGYTVKVLSWEPDEPDDGRRPCDVCDGLELG